MASNESGLYGFRPNIDGIRTVFQGQAIRDELAAIVEPIAVAASANAQEPEAFYQSYVDMGEYTAIGKVVCGNQAARRDNARNNTILKAR